MISLLDVPTISTRCRRCRPVPYYKVFEDEASSWHARLTKVHVLFDVWIDVQRQWVYLEGIFNDNMDIQTLLPTESTRFASINGEFMALMRKVSKGPRLLEVLSLPGVQQVVERLYDALHKIQRALGEYLDRERSRFPRFYFVGDEDLLEIIGNARSIDRIQKHMQKLFPGITRLLVSEDGEFTNGCLQLSKHVKAHWRHGTRSALVALHGAKVDKEGLREWIGGFAAQMLLLAVQCDWTATMESARSKNDRDLNSLDQSSASLLELLAELIAEDLSHCHEPKSNL
ncbi:hypothetical protein MRB53_039587 [Persea americana]|nr:hypothetical protein MRB53_039587 [Persea americana]